MKTLMLVLFGAMFFFGFWIPLQNLASLALQFPIK